MSLRKSDSLVLPFVETNESDFRKLIVWSGQKNFYDGFDDWKTVGDVGASTDKLVWLSDRGDVASISLDALTLDRETSSPNPGINAATNGNNAGADISKLPHPADADPRSE